MDKSYIQVTSGRGPVECCRVVVLVMPMKLSAIEKAKQMQQTHDVWMNHNTLERGNPVKKFKGDL